MLVLWCGAEVKVIKDVIGPVLRQHEVPHRVEPDISTLPHLCAGDVVLAFGTKALKTLQDMGVAPKGRTVTSTRGTPFGVGGAKVLVTFDPGVVSRDYARLPDIQWDIQLAVRLHNTGTIEPVVGKYTLVESFHEIIDRVEYLHGTTGAAVEVACDLETKGLDEFAVGAWIISCSFTVDSGVSQVAYFSKGERPQKPPPGIQEDHLTYWQALWEQINWLLTTSKISLRGANFKFDSRWLNYHWGIDCTNHKLDTTLVGSLLDENRSNSLKLHAKLFTSLGGYEDGMDKYDFSCLEKVPVTELVQYNGGDTDATLQVATHFKKQLLKDRQLVNFYTKVTHPASKAFERLERNGIYVDVPYYHRLQNELEVEIDRIHSELIGMMPTALRNKYADNLKITRLALLRDFLFTPAGLNLKAHLFTAAENLPSTAMDHLLSFKDNPDAAAFISLLNEHGSATKTLSTYVVGFLKHLRSDGRFHPSFMLHRGGYGDSDDDTGTVTGRCLTAEARILTDKGEIQIKELIELFESGVSFQVLTHKNRWMPVTQVYRNGPKPVCTVKAAGRSLTSTYNHPFMSFPSWTLAEDLKVGSWLYAKASPPPLEEWLPVTGWPFEVSNMGRVRRALDGKNVTAGTLVAQRPKGPWGHLKVTLTRFVGGRDKKDFPVHTLVADAFLKNNGGVEVAHLNGDASCNWSTNLKRVSVSENKLHFMLHGTANRDSQKKLTWAKVDAIRSGALGDDHEASAALFVSRELVRDVRLFKRWNGRRDSMAGFIPIQVEAILDAGVQDTFDLTVEEDHSFIANGLVVHNTSAKAPAVQTIPKHTKWSKRLRRAFIAPPGYTILNLDYSQGELRICAVVAEEPTMIQAYRDGKDLHAITAAGLNGYSFDEFMLLPDEVRDELRSGGKAGNFGLIYGMQHLGFRDYAWYSYGVSMTDEEAFNARSAFFDLYTRLLPWHEESKRFARLRGYIRSPLGRIRHLPLINSPDRESRAKAERQAINSPIQSALSDLMQMAMVAINRQYGHEDIRAFMMTHDSLSLYVLIDRAYEWAVRLRDIMENLPLLRDFGWDSPLKFIADAEVGVPDDEGVISLARLQKVKFL